MKFTRTSRLNKCPLCGTEKSKCGAPHNNPNVRLCMTYHSKEEAPPGWKYVGETRGGQWGIFVPAGREYTEEELAAYKQRRNEEEYRRRQRHIESLSESTRHLNHEKLFGQLSLSEKHREDLKRRGLSNELINAGYFRSIDKFQQLDFEVSHNLAGVSITGRSLTNHITGYTVPVWNEHFQIVGYQIRNDDIESGAKYLWATSKTNVRRKAAISSHLQNGELPLTFCVPWNYRSNNGDILNLSKNSNGSVEPLQIQGYAIQNYQSDKTLAEFINISEGILKAYIIAQLRQLLVIGASGGNFIASVETFKRYLSAASNMLNGTKNVVLWADAGAIANKQVMRQYRNTYYLLKKWGYTLQVAWWGQIDKNCLDGDEYLGEYELISWQQFDGMARHPNQFWDSVKKEISRIKRCLTRSTQKPFFAPELPLQEKTIKYVPGFLPTYGDYVELGCPKIIYANHERVTIWKEAVLKGWSHILDKSAPGLGKSHTVGSLTADYMGVDQLMYLASDHRNPTTITIEKNFVDVFPRHGGLDKDPTRLTQEGKQFLTHTSGKGKPDIIANCARHYMFGATRKKNLDLESSDNIICQGCNLLNLCQQGSGDSFGYLSERMEALKHPQIRLHPNSTPLPTNYDYEKVGAFWDEASVLIRSKKKIEVRIGDLYNSPLAPYMSTFINQTEFLNQFPPDSPLIIVCKVLLKLFETPKGELGRYGLDDNDIHSLLGKAPTSIIDVVRDLIDNSVHNLDFLAELPDRLDTSKLSKQERDNVTKFNKALRGQHNSEAYEKLESLPLNWLVPMLEVWAGYIPGYFSFNNGVLTIHEFDGRHREVARAAAFNIYLDGTMPVENLRLKLGIEKEHILVLETETPDYSNLEIVHIPDMGVLGRDRRETQQTRVDALRDAIVKLEQEKSNNSNVLVGCIERKAFAHEGDGYHFRDSRGVNRFSDVSALIGIGVPYANIGEMKAEYSLLMKDEYIRKRNKSNNNTKVLLNLICHMPTAGVVLLIKPLQEYTQQDYIDGLVDAEVLQEIGRLRSHLRLDESLTYYFVGEYDLSPIVAHLPGVKYGVTTAAELSPMSAGGEQRTMLMVMNAIGNLIARGIFSPKQREVEAELEAHSYICKVKQERISQLMKHFGGWRAAVKLIRNTLAAVGKDSPTTANSFDDEQWIIRTYLPLIAETAITDPVTAAYELVSIAVAHGWENLLSCVSKIEYGLQQQFVELILQLYALVDTESIEELLVDGG
ncbi:hypothetical protein CAL7716_100000 (plasmid) [Calothrix sp. PCC 7716]|nr:hypothetical protein CAL7716_100000 [Calothrix sp. PCC 7716]